MSTVQYRVSYEWFPYPLIKASSLSLRSRCDGTGHANLYGRWRRAAAHGLHEPDTVYHVTIRQG